LKLGLKMKNEEAMNGGAGSPEVGAEELRKRREERDEEGFVGRTRARADSLRSA